MTGLYLHFPFCVKKCSYCDFVSFPDMLSEGERYVSALISEMEEYQRETLDTIYFGGGTPTALAPELLAQVLCALKRNFSLTKDCEITVEANPGTCTESGFSLLKEAGVNRVSLGVQSLVDKELSLLGRIHSAEDAKEAVNMARRAGIENLSLDLMFSIPEQTRESLLFTLEKMVKLAPEHLSCYSLMLCEGTPMMRAAEAGKLSLPDDEEDRERYGLLTEFLEAHGYHRYEISNFAKDGKLSRHNTKYWKREPYIGLGAAAHSFYDDCRFENPDTLSAYYDRVKEKKHPTGEPVTGRDAMGEFMFLGLRMTKEGVLRKDFLACFGKNLDAVFGQQVKKLCGHGLLTDDGEKICLTERGIDLSNTVFCELL